MHRARKFHAALSKLSGTSEGTNSSCSEQTSDTSSIPRRMTCSEFPARRYYDGSTYSLKKGDDDSDDSDDYDETEEEETEEEEEEEAPIKQVYVLDDVSKRRPEVPLLCVAERSIMRTLMASAIYNRAVWKILDPVVCVSFHPLSCAVQLIVGWCDEPITTRILVSVISVYFVAGGVKEVAL